MLRVGIAGIGFMGMVHHLSYAKLRGVKVAAIADPSAEKRAGDWRSIKGNFGPPGAKMDLSGVATYESVDEMIADPSLDAIDVTLPPALHADVACRALAAGKHVFCEKPMAMRLADCDRMVRAAQRTQANGAGKQLYIGHVLPYFPEYAWALKEIESGKHGALLGGAFKRVISDPAWLTHYWDADRVGGPMLDLHIHDAHFIRLAFGKPAGVTTRGRMRNGLPEHWTTQFDFGDEGVAVTATSGTINQQGRPFQHGFEIHLERATLVFDFAVIGGEGAYLCPPTLLTHDGKAKRPKLAGDDPMDAFKAELREVVRCLQSDEPSPVLGAELARDAIQLCQAQSKSLATGRRVKV
ncbi:Glucose--fructose oxidoreductase precursor [Botrimarina colliarenosi]|uniref:Glucose--fructose oxidoreductase n=1 Tax=Botrimarina colliarenosi TaxID=2528001 RepID=A0A5C6AL92_9BACT|nr:Gfo/Idh/MocA family oxidoreductase [Botrimarina colliarenosi]TWU00248.1 Glucose--fructose oxidoreductase precursor [Botrimarina colliarenosi]